MLLVCGYMHVPLAFEDIEVRDVWNFARVPSPDWSMPLKCARWDAIVDMGCYADSKFLEAIQQASSM